MFRLPKLRSKMRKLPHEEIVTLAMLFRENQPIKCSCCMGDGHENRLWGMHICGQCDGTGYDWIGPKTKEYLYELNP